MQWSLISGFSLNVSPPQWRIGYDEKWLHESVHIIFTQLHEIHWKMRCRLFMSNENWLAEIQWHAACESS